MRIQRLRNDIFKFAQEIEGGIQFTKKEMQERYAKILWNSYFNRELLVDTLESHDIILSANVRFLIIDNVDLILTLWKRIIENQPSDK